MAIKRNEAEKTKQAQKLLDEAIKLKQEKEDKLAQLEQKETHTRQTNKTNVEREENLWVYKQFHDKVAKKDWLEKTPLEILKKNWIDEKLEVEHPGMGKRKKSFDDSVTEKRRGQLEEEFFRAVKENAIPLENPEACFPLYFQKPEELMEIFLTLEEQNVMLIQKNQGLLKEIEDKKGLFRGTKAKMGKIFSTAEENERKLKEKTQEEEKRLGGEKTTRESQDDEGVSAALKVLKNQVFSRETII